MLTLGRKSAAERVASFLLLIAMHDDPGRERGPTRFALPLTRADIADFLGLTIETVSRQLTRLRRAGVIRFAGVRDVEVPDIDRLREMVG
jgi:CRP/FNR family transcriptional regulator